MVQADTLEWLMRCPAGDVNFTSHLQRANAPTLLAALRGRISITATRLIERRLRQLEREMRQSHAAHIGGKVNAKSGTQADYCSRCGMLRSQCDCWDPVNQK